MTAVDYILDGLEKALEVERECGVRAIEIDRALIKPARPQALDASAQQSVNISNLKSQITSTPASPPTPSLSTPASPPPPPPSPSAPSTNTASHPLVFIHDRPLSPKAIEMMAKILAAMHQTVESAPIVVAPPIPEAEVYVFLGAAALAKYQPELRLADNSWGRSAKGKEILLVRSPEEIVRFATVTPAVKELKLKMWKALQEVMKRVEGI